MNDLQWYLHFRKPPNICIYIYIGIPTSYKVYMCVGTTGLATSLLTAMLRLQTLQKLPCRWRLASLAGEEICKNRMTYQPILLVKRIWNLQKYTTKWCDMVWLYIQYLTICWLNPPFAAWAAPSFICHPKMGEIPPQNSASLPETVFLWWSSKRDGVPSGNLT